MIRKCSVIMAFVLVAMLPLFAGQDFRRGYIVTNNGDTINGFIDHQPDYNLKDSCRFTTNISDSGKKYFPAELNGFHFDKESRRFVKATLPGDNASQIIFIEELASGKLNLYVHTDLNHGRNFYIRKANETSLVEVPYSIQTKKYYNGLVINSMVNGTTNHIDTLKKYMADAEPLYRDIEMIETPTKTKLVKLIKEYNSFTNEKAYIAEHAIKRLPWNLYISPGLFFTSLKRYVLLGGTEVCIGFANTNQHYFLKTGIFLSSTRDYEASSANSDYAKHTLIKVPLQFEYRFPDKLIQPRISVGCNYYAGDSISVLHPSISAGINLKVSDRVSFVLMPGMEFKGFRFVSPVLDWFSRYNNFSLFTGIQIKL